MSKSKKSLLVTYWLWLVGGLLGLHHVYLGRHRHAFVWWCLLGGLGAGWIRDLWRIPEYVREASGEEEFLESLRERMRNRRKPRLSALRCLGELVLGLLFHSLADFSISDCLGVRWNLQIVRDLEVLMPPTLAAVGVWVVGSVGRESGRFCPTLSACYLFWPLGGLVTTLAGVVVFNKVREWRSLDNSATARSFLCLAICCVIYTGAVARFVCFEVMVETEEEETITVGEALNRFLNSSEYQAFLRDCELLWQSFRQGGLQTTLRYLVDDLGKMHAFHVMGLNPEATPREIRARHRELSRRLHPDRVRDPEEKEEAQKK